MKIGKWLGLRNTTAPEAIKPGGLERALDVDIDDAGALRSRDGKTLVSATAAHSLWASGDMALVVHGQDLKRADLAAGTFTQLRRLTSAEPVSFAQANGVVYFCNGTDTGRIVGGEPKEWGVRAPLGQPAAAPDGGGLAPGRYLYAMTFIRSDGLESGTPTPGAVEITSEHGGIVFTNLPTSSDPDVVGRALYVSAVNGVEMYRAAAISSAASVYYLRTLGLDLGPVLDPDLVTPPPPSSTIVEIHAGAAYLADGHVVWASDLFSLERFRPRSRFLQFPGEVTMLAAVTGGMYVGTDKATYYLAGKDPSAMNSVLAASHGATRGTVAKLDVSIQASEEEEPTPNIVAAMWMSPEGVIMGMPGGSLRNLTTGNYNVPSGVRGAALLRSGRGYSSYVVTIQGEQGSPNAY